MSGLVIVVIVVVSDPGLLARPARGTRAIP